MRIGACEPLRERTRAKVHRNGDAAGAILLFANSLAAYRPFLPRLLAVSAAAIGAAQCDVPTLGP